MIALMLPVALMAQEEKDTTIVVPQAENTLRMAAELSKYGYANKDALSLIQAARLSKQAGFALEDRAKDEVEEMRRSYNQRRRFLMHEFKRMGLECFEPFGAFYVFPSIREFGMSSEEFATRLLEEEKVAVVPGTAFGECGEGFLRISYAYSLEDLKEALGRLESFIRKLRKEQE